MANIGFTERRVLEFPVPEVGAGEKAAQRFYWDARTPGLGLRVTSAGARSYVFQGHLSIKGASSNGGGENNRSRRVSFRITIGDSRSWPLGRAQEEARRLQALTDRGIDPREEKASALRRLAQERDARAHQHTTFAEAWRAYCEVRAPRWGERTLADHRKALAPGGKPKTRGRKRGDSDTTAPGVLMALSDLPVGNLTRDVLRQWLTGEVARRPTQAALAFRMLRAFMNWAAMEGGWGVDAEACGGLARDVLERPKPKSDSLQREQLGLWFQGVRAIPNPVVSAYLQVVLLTGGRREEVASLRWDDVDFEWRTLRIRDKVEGERTIPLTPYVATLLAGLPRRTMPGARGAMLNPWVFSSPQSASGRLQEPRKAHSGALQAVGLPSVSIHGLRRSFGSLAEWVEAPIGIVAQIMGHKPSALAEKHYRVRPIDLLRQWHARIEAWILEQAGIEQPAVGGGAGGLLRLVVGSGG